MNLLIEESILMAVSGDFMFFIFYIFIVRSLFLDIILFDFVNNVLVIGLLIIIIYLYIKIIVKY